jgi:hypothetical protein
MSEMLVSADEVSISLFGTVNLFETMIDAGIDVAHLCRRTFPLFGVPRSSRRRTGSADRTNRRRNCDGNQAELS